MRRRLLAPTLLLLPWLLASDCEQVPRLPALAASSPAAGGSAARSVWPVLHFAGPLGTDPGSQAILTCDGTFVPKAAHALDADTLVLQPHADLPAQAACELRLHTVSGVTTVAFQTSSAGAAFEAIYDRTNRDRPLPFPDDVFLVPDAGNPTGFALDLVLPNIAGSASVMIDNLAAVVEAGSDGWSPLGNLAVQLSAVPDQASLPLDRAASLDPLSSVALVDLTPGSPSFGERIPFQLIVRSDTFAPEPVVHALVIFPGLALEPEGTYGLVVTDRVISGEGQPLARSAFFQAALGPPLGGEAAQVAATRPLAEDVLAVAETLSPLPIPRGDVVLATRITVRSTDHFPDDLLAMREDVLATPPNVQIASVVNDPFANTAALVTGTFDVPVWVQGAFVARGPDGLPVATGTQAVPFVMMLPNASASPGAAPVLMYQHGSPGSAQNEVPNAARNFLAAAGFAVAGFTDTLNRQFSTVTEQQFALLGNVLFNGEVPDYYIQHYAEQMAFVRALQSLASLDVLPLGAPDGIPDLDPGTLVYEGISYGSNHAQAFLAYEPDIRAAALVAGAVRFVELIEYQDRTLPLGGDPLLRVTLPAFLTGLRAPDLWMGLHLFAITYDRQDPHNHARFLYREPLEIDGTTQKASLLVVEGIDDSFTSNNSTRSLARQLGGIPQLAPAVIAMPDLPQQAGPIQGNVDATTTAAMVQFAPGGAAVPPTPGCEFQFEGHYCAQTAPAARAQRVDFYQSALVGVPVID